MEFIACTWSLNIKDEDYPFYLLYGEKGSITVVRQTDDFLVVSYNSDRLRGRFIEIFCDHYELPSPASSSDPMGSKSSTTSKQVTPPSVKEQD